MSVRSQRHLREFYGIDSAGESDGPPQAPVPALGLDFSILTPETLAAAGVTYSSLSLRMRYDSTGKLTYSPNNVFSPSETVPYITPGSAVTVTDHAATDVRGVNNAQLLTCVASNTEHQAYYNGGVDASKNCIASIEVKQGTAAWAFVMCGTNTKNYGTYINLSTGALGSSFDSPRGVSREILANGWYRVNIAITQDAAGGNVYPAVFFAAANGSGRPSFAADGTETMYVGSVQVEVVTYETAFRGAYHHTTGAAYYGPRFDYDPATLAFKGILIEDQSTNLVKWSNFASYAGDVKWGSGNGDVALNNALAPDGTMSAAKIMGGASDGGGTYYSDNYNGIAINPTDKYAMSIYVKAGTVTTFEIKPGYSGADFRFFFDIGATPQVNSTPSNEGTGTGVNAGMQYVGNGWWWCWIVGSTNPSGYAGAYPAIYFTNGFSGTDSFVTTSGDYLYAWGVQFEHGLFPTSLIQTDIAFGAGFSATREVDTATITTVPAIALINADEYSTFVDFTTGHPHGDGNPDYDVIAFSGSAYPTTEIPYSDAIGYVGNVSGGWGVINTSGGHYLLRNTRYKYAFSVGPNTASGVRDSDPVAHSGAYTKPTDYQTIKLGWEVTHRMGGWIKTFNIYNTRLTDAQLQALTT